MFWYISAIATIIVMLFVKLTAKENPIYITCLGERYYRKAKRCKAKFHKILWNPDGTYSAELYVPAIKSVITVAATRDFALKMIHFMKEKMSEDEPEISVLQYKVNGGDYFELPSDWNADIEENKQLQTNHQVVDNGAPLECLIARVKKAQTVGTVLVIASLIFLVIEPRIALVLALLEVGNVMLNISFPSDDYYKTKCIIADRDKSKGPKGQQPIGEDGFPKGYEEWSDTEKYIYSLKNKYSSPADEDEMLSEDEEAEPIEVETSEVEIVPEQPKEKNEPETKIDEPIKETAAAVKPVKEETPQSASDENELYETKGNKPSAKKTRRKKKPAEPKEPAETEAEQLSFDAAKGAVQTEAEEEPEF